MYLKSIELTGFKSFGKKISLEFGSRIAAIVGPNGSGKCVTGDTPVQLANGSRLPIKDLFDNAFEGARKLRVYEDGVAIVDTGETVDILAMDQERQVLTARPIAAFVRRTAPEEILEVTLKSGRRIKATPYHPLFTLENGKVNATRADALRQGVRIATPRKLPVSAHIQKFSMFAVLSKFNAEDKVYIPYSSSLVDRLVVNSGKRSATYVSKQTGVSADTVQSFFDRQALSAHAAAQLFSCDAEDQCFPDRILKSKTTGTMTVPRELDEKMARFLGYLIAEGRNCANGQIRFVNDDVPCVDDFVACAKECFDVSTTVRSYRGRGILDAFISSLTLSRFLDRVLGVTQDGHSRDKTVPQQIFASPNNVIAAFLSALFEGDGHLHVSKATSRGNYIEYATASENLARGVNTLLLRFGVNAAIRPKMKRATNGTSPARLYWSVFVYGNDQLRELAQHLSFKGRKKDALEAFRNLPSAANPNLDLLPNVTALVRDVARESGVSIKRLRKESPTLAAYYEQRCDASRAGILRCVAMIEKYGILTESVQAKLEQLRLIATSDVYWDEIVSIKPLRGEKYVYDLSVAIDHNFIADDIVVHNSNVADGFRFVLGEQSMKSMRGKRGEDMIWGGSPALPRMNRAAVKLVFDNSKRLLDIDFSEVVLERVVHRDGQNEYLLNGSQVRLKDVIRLLAGANIGGSGYQIISQGEADRILNASPRERREMVEDALGLKLYQHKKAESERKLEETAVNIDTTKSLRRELAPHLKFLQVQVEKIEKAREMKDELAELLRDYLARENAWITMENARLSDEISEIGGHIRDLEAKLKEAQKAKGHTDDGAREKALRALEDLQHALSDARRKREDIVRELGRAEGALEATNVTVEAIVPAPHVRDFVREVTDSIEEAEQLDDVLKIKARLSSIRAKIQAFIENLTGMAPITNKEAEDAVGRLAVNLKKAEEDESRLAGETERVRGEMTRVREASFAAEKEEVEIEAKLREAQSKLVSLKAEKEHVAVEKRRYEEEVREGVALIGTAMMGWDTGTVPEGALSEDRGAQEKRRRAVERLKIKIEEADAGGGDAVVKEFKQTEERDAFLAKELEDLEKSSAALQDIIAELEETIDERFKEGLKHINEALDTFFAKLFGGGHAKLFIEEPRRMSRRRLDMEDMEEVEVSEEEELYAGLSIDVSLPRKKIRGLEVLSGGERALTSIALIFSMSQVNPPPFLILDETDAALDEANSKRYADMIMELGKKSQLIVITHNRATMSAAGELYGVTMGQDGVSKVLSVKLEEAERVAK